MTPAPPTPRLRRAARILAALCLAAGLLLALAPAPSGAVAPIEVGYWSKVFPLQSDERVTGQHVGDVVLFDGVLAQVPGPDDIPNPIEGPVTTVPLPVPPPTVPESPATVPGPGEDTPNPGVPEGGLWVANDLTGPRAVSALRFQGDIGAGILRLDYAPGSTLAAPLAACPIVSDWTPVAGGAWENRPAEDCGRFRLTGRLVPDGTAIQFSIPQGFVPFGQRFLDIAIVPVPGSGEVFDAYFEAPSADSFEVIQAQVPPPSETTLPPPTNLPTTMPPATVARPSTGAGNAPAAVPAPVVTRPIADTPEEIATGTTIVGGGTGGVIPTPVAEFVEPLTESRAGRILSVFLLLALAGGLFWLSSQPVRAPRLIGGAAAGGGAVPVSVPVPVEPATTRGIGRFRRDRTAPPERL